MSSYSFKYKIRETRLTIVLLDLIGSTKFIQSVGPVKAARWLQYHDRMTRSLIYRFNGREIDRTDGFLLSFDSTLAAVNFALKYQETIPLKTLLKCRIGIHWGKVVEVHQDDLLKATGIKPIELEGIAKNIAARTMGLCGPGQVLLTKEAMLQVKHRRDMHTPKGMRIVCVGLYKFKGVRYPQEVYAAGTNIKVLQPPKGGDKAKRLGGPNKVKKHARDMLLMDWAYWLVIRLGFLALLFWIYLLTPIILNPDTRQYLGLPYSIEWLDLLVNLLSNK